jgi:hypothetical protein
MYGCRRVYEILTDKDVKKELFSINPFHHEQEHFTFLKINAQGSHKPKIDYILLEKESKSYEVCKVNGHLNNKPEN